MPDDGESARSHQSARTPRQRDDKSDRRDDRLFAPTSRGVVARFHHLACAARHEPYKLCSALATCTLDGLDRAGLAAIERALSVVDPAEAEPTTREAYLRFVATIRETGDAEALLVFADWLQTVGNPRGELGAVQAALEHATADQRGALEQTEKHLLAEHRARLVPDRLDAVWRSFVHRLVIGATELEPASVARWFAHPSFRFVRELEVARGSPWKTVVVAPSLPALPATLRWQSSCAATCSATSARCWRAPCPSSSA